MEDQLSRSDIALRDSVLLDFWKAQLTYNQLMLHLSQRYSLSEGDQVNEDGSIQRAKQEVGYPLEQEQWIPPVVNDHRPVDLSKSRRDNHSHLDA